MIFSTSQLRQIVNAVLKYSQRKKLPTGSFAYPEKRAYPIHDAGHVRAALQRYSQFKKNIPPGVRGRVLGRIMAAAKRFGITVNPKKFSSSVMTYVMGLPSERRVEAVHDIAERYLDKILPA